MAENSIYCFAEIPEAVKGLRLFSVGKEREGKGKKRKNKVHLQTYLQTNQFFPAIEKLHIPKIF